jgi:hypothetical protein
MIALLGLVSTAGAHIPVIWLAGPTDYCEVLAGTIGNDFVMLEPGEYRGPCRFDANLSDVPVELTTLQSLDPANPAVFVGTSGDVVLELGGERVILLAVTFRDLPAGVDAVRLDAPREAWVRQVTFEDVAGTAVRALGGEVHVVGSTFRDVGTAVQLDCVPCVPAADLADNLVSGATLAVGVGPGGSAVVRDDVYVAATGVRSDGDVVLDGLLVDASAVGLDLGQGPAVVSASVVRAPIAARTARAPDGVVLLGDTLLGDLVLPEWDARSRLVGSALDRPPPGLGQADVAGAIVCGADCFADAERIDVYPLPGAPLIGAGVVDPASRADWCGFPRQSPPTAGAFEFVGEGSYGPLPLAAKQEFVCALPPVVVDSGSQLHTGAPLPPHSGAPPDDPPIVAPPGERGCGCAAVAPSSPRAPAALLTAVVCAGVRRRSRRLDRLHRLR